MREAYWYVYVGLMLTPGPMTSHNVRRPLVFAALVPISIAHLFWHHWQASGMKIMLGLLLGLTACLGASAGACSRRSACKKSYQYQEMSPKLSRR